MRAFAGCIFLAVFCCAFVVVSSQRRRVNALQLMAGLSPEVFAALGSAEKQYPDRPEFFKTPGELRRYLEELNSFYAITGRPRFGKRNGQRRSLSSSEERTASEPYIF